MGGEGLWGRQRAELSREQGQWRDLGSEASLPGSWPSSGSVRWWNHPVFLLCELARRVSTAQWPAFVHPWPRLGEG